MLSAGNQITVIQTSKDCQKIIETSNSFGDTISKFFGFKEKPFFKAEEGAKIAPKSTQIFGEKYCTSK